MSRWEKRPEHPGPVHTQHTLSVSVSTHRGVQRGQLWLLEPQLVQLSAEKAAEGQEENRGCGKKEEEEEEQTLEESMRRYLPPPREALETSRKKNKGGWDNRKGAVNKTIRQLSLRTGLVLCGNRLRGEGTVSNTPQTCR